MHSIYFFYKKLQKKMQENIYCFVFFSLAPYLEKEALTWQQYHKIKDIVVLLISVESA